MTAPSEKEYKDREAVCVTKLIESTMHELVHRQGMGADDAAQTIRGALDSLIQRKGLDAQRDASPPPATARGGPKTARGQRMQAEMADFQKEMLAVQALIHNRCGSQRSQLAALNTQAEQLKGAVTARGETRQRNPVEPEAVDLRGGVVKLKGFLDKLAQRQGTEGRQLAQVPGEVAKPAEPPQKMVDVHPLTLALELGNLGGVQTALDPNEEMTDFLVETDDLDSEPSKSKAAGAVPSTPDLAVGADGLWAGASGSKPHPGPKDLGLAASPTKLIPEMRDPETKIGVSGLGFIGGQAKSPPRARSLRSSEMRDVAAEIETLGTTLLEDYHPPEEKPSAPEKKDPADSYETKAKPCAPTPRHSQVEVPAWQSPLRRRPQQPLAAPRGRVSVEADASREPESSVAGSMTHRAPNQGTHSCFHPLGPNRTLSPRKSVSPWRPRAQVLEAFVPAPGLPPALHHFKPWSPRAPSPTQSSPQLGPPRPSPQPSEVEVRVVTETAPGTQLVQHSPQMSQTAICRMSSAPTFQQVSRLSTHGRSISPLTHRNSQSSLHPLPVAEDAAVEVAQPSARGCMSPASPNMSSLGAEQASRFEWWSQAPEHAKTPVHRLVSLSPQRALPHSQVRAPRVTRL